MEEARLRITIVDIMAGGRRRVGPDDRAIRWSEESLLDKIRSRLSLL